MPETDLPIARVIIPNQNDNVLVVRRKRGYFAGKWELPGGQSESLDLMGELLREVREEVGISLDPKDVDRLFWIKMIDIRKKISIFSAEPLPMIRQTLYLSRSMHDPVVVLGSEHNRFRWLPAKSFHDTKSPNKFTDFTLSALSFYFYGMRKYPTH